MVGLGSPRSHISSRISSVEVMFSRLLNGSSRSVIGLIILRFLLSDNSLFMEPINTLNGNCPYIWHGGSPEFNKGSCWCGADGYCMCTPSLAIDVVIEVIPPEYLTNSNANGITSATNVPLNQVHFMLIKRRDPPRDIFAIPGGFVQVGESVEHASVREVKEETNIEIYESELTQFHVYSDPNRDARRHTVSQVNILTITKDSDRVVNMHPGDDTKAIRIVPVDTILHQSTNTATVTGTASTTTGVTTGITSGTDSDNIDMAFDHRQIITDYVKYACSQHKYIECGDNV